MQKGFALTKNMPPAIPLFIASLLIACYLMLSFFDVWSMFNSEGTLAPASNQSQTQEDEGYLPIQPDTSPQVELQ